MHLTFFSFVSLLTCAVQSLPIMVGGWKKVTDLDSQFIKSTADKSIKLYQAENVGGKVLRLLKVLDAYTQRVAGMNYKLVLQVNLLNCTEQEEAEHLSNQCKVEKTGLCYFQLYTKIWTSANLLTYQFCSGFVPVLNSRPVDLLNTWLPVEPDYPVALYYAALSFSLYDDGTYALESLAEGSFRNSYNFDSKFVEYEFKLVMVNHLCEQDGSYCDKYVCKVVLKVELWTDASKLTFKECKSAEEDTDSEDYGPLVGGFYRLEPKSLEVQEVVRKSVKIYESQRNARVVAFFVDSAVAQVVAGTKYKINLKLVQCRTPRKFGKCDDFKTCLFEVLDKPWTSTFTLKASCDDQLRVISIQ